MTDDTHGLSESELRAAEMCRMTPVEYAAFKDPRIDPAEFARKQTDAQEHEQTKQAFREVLDERGGEGA